MRALMGRWERFRRAISEALLWGRRKGENAEKMGYSLFKSAGYVRYVADVYFFVLLSNLGSGMGFQKRGSIPALPDGIIRGVAAKSVT